jgi:hypothetical protein
VASILSLDKILIDDHLMKVLTGLSAAEFVSLQPAFSRGLQEAESGKGRPSAGRPHSLTTVADKLFFILFYVRCHPTFDVAGLLYEVDRAQTYRWFKTCLPALEAALGREVVLPDRKIKDVASFLVHVPEVEEVFPNGVGGSVRGLVDLQRPERGDPGEK